MLSIIGTYYYNTNVAEIIIAPSRIMKVIWSLARALPNPIAKFSYSETGENQDKKCHNRESCEINYQYSGYKLATAGWATHSIEMI
jgi:hypothetical protein